MLLAMQRDSQVLNALVTPSTGLGLSDIWHRFTQANSLVVERVSKELLDTSNSYALELTDKGIVRCFH